MQSYRDNPFGSAAQSNHSLADHYDSYAPQQFSNENSSSFANQPYSTPTARESQGISPYTHQPLATSSTNDVRTSDYPAQNTMYTEPDFGEDNGRSAWVSNEKSGKRPKWVIIASILGVVGIIIIAVVVGVVVSHKNKNNQASSNGSNSNVDKSSSDNKPGSKPGDSSDASVFTKDPNLHQSFYGLAYTPEGSQLPNCGNKLEDVITDIQLLSQLTTRIRLYGADCNQSALVLEAIKQTKVDMTVFLGNYPIATDNDAAYQRQRDVIKSAIQTYGADHIGGVTVGNEFMLNYLTDHQATDPNSDIGMQGAAILLKDIQDTRDMLKSLSLSKDLPVGTSDAGSYFNNEILAGVDYGMANVHAWFAQTTAEGAAAWVSQFFQEQNVNPANALPNKPKMYIAETGWPTKSSDAAHATNGAGTASEAGLQTFLDTFVCQANQNGTGYFFFEYFDEGWKDAQFGGVEGWWGLFNANRTLKNIKIPDCKAP